MTRGAVQAVNDDIHPADGLAFSASSSPKMTRVGDDVVQDRQAG